MNTLTRIAAGAFVVGVLAALAVTALLHWGLPARAGAGDVTLVAIDTDITGNNDTTVGIIDDCGEIANVGTHNEDPPAAGTTLTFDLVAEGVDTVDKIAAYKFDIDYDNTVIEIIGVIPVDGTPTDELLGGIPTGAVTMISRVDTWGGAGFLNTSESAGPLADLADIDGSYTAAAADATSSILVGTHPPDGHESGAGVLARITVRSVGTGQSPLTIPGVAGGPDGFPDAIILAGDGPLLGTAIPISTIQGAAISTGGVTCVAPTPTPTPPPGIQTDVQVTSVTTTSPAGTTVGAPFAVTADVVVSNNGGLDPVNVDTTIELNLPGDCTTSDTNPLTVQDTSISVAASPVSPPQASCSVTSTSPARRMRS